MSWMTLVVSLVVAGVVSPVAGLERDSQTAADRLVSTAWLAEHLSDPDLVLLHVGDPAKYPAAHLSGARLVNLSDISVSEHSATGLMLQMPPDLKARLEALGISDRSRIVVYAADNYSSPSTRVMFTLDYAGLGGQASLLQGGMGAWTREGRPTTEAVPPSKTGHLSDLKTEPIVVDAAFVLSRLETPGVRIVDGRAKAFYDGVQTGGGRDNPMPPHKTGHIKGAASVPFTDIFDVEGRVKPVEDLRAIFEAAGVKPGDTVVGYCHIGQQATAMLFAAKLLGHRVQLFDGSFEEWSRTPNAPVTNPSGKEQ
jgi:thiosulfate/3-mercaptopyruvate sulfurtransferase